MPRRFVYFQGRRGAAAVLYSVLNGNLREFWVKIPAADVKVFEFDETKTLSPFFSWGDSVGDSTTSTATASAGNNSSGSAQSLNGYAIFPIATSGQLNVSVTGQYISGSGSRNGNVRSSLTTAAQVNVSAGTPTGSNTDSTFLSGTAPGGLNLGKSRRFDAGVNLSSVASTGTISWSGSVTHTIASFTESVVTTAYEAWLSATASEIYVIIKYLEDSLVEDDPETEEDSFDRLQLITLNKSGSILASESYAIGDEVPPNPQNWRDVLSDFRAIADQEPALESCVDLYKSSADSNLFDGKSAVIPLSQEVNGQTLVGFLESSPGSIVALATTQSATSDDTCTLGTAAESTVQVPSPARGTIEGITYLP